MIGRVILAALLAGIAAGLIMGFIQHVRLTPLILEAEVYETAGLAHDPLHAGSGEEAAPHAHANTYAGPQEGPASQPGAAPADDWRRTLGTTVTLAMTGAAYAAVLAGISLLTGLPITRRNGVVWGLCGFLAATVAPAMGLPPELPGMPAGDLIMRKIWWTGTVAATAAAIYLIATRRDTWGIAAAVILIGLPHIIGAPAPASQVSAVPAGLAASFAANAIAAGAIFWVLIGTFLGLALNRYAGNIYAT